MSFGIYFSKVVDTTLSNGGACVDWLLNLKINFMRDRLEEYAKKYGRGHPKTLALSQRLDNYLVDYQRRFC